MTARQSEPLEPGGGPPGRHGGERSPDVAELVALLRKAASTINVFPANSPSWRRVVSETADALSNYCGLHGHLELVVGPESFFHEGSPVGGESAGRYLGYRLYRDGIREVTFESGIAAAEIVGFLKLIAPRHIEAASEADTVSAILSKEFAHVKFLVSQDIFTEEVMTEQDAAAANANLAGLGFYAPLDDDLPAMVDAIRAILSADPEPDVAELQREALTAGADALAAMNDVFMAALDSDIAPELKQSTAQRMVDVAAEHFDGGRFEEGLATVQRLAALPPERQDNIGAQIDRMFGDDFIKAVAQRLNEAGGVAPGPLKNLLRFMGARNLDRLCDLAAQVGDVTMLKDAIVDASRHRPGDILRRLGQCADQRLAGVLVGVVESLGDARAAAPLAQMLPRQQGWLKTQTIGALAALGGPEARTALAGLLDDGESWVRVAALRALARIGDGDSLRRIERFAHGAAFCHADAVEQQAAWHALLELAGSSAPAIARRVLRRRSLWHRRRAEAEKLTFLAAAARTGNAALGAFLESEAVRLGGQSELSKACRDAAQAIGQAAAGGQRKAG